MQSGGPYGGRDPSGRAMRSEDARSLERKSMFDNFERVKVELDDYKKAYEIALQLVGLPPAQQKHKGQYYRSYLTEKGFPNVREFVQRLLAIPQED